MFGLEFLFSAALWALPLAGLPILLHLLFRRRSPIMQFSTVRFIKASIQHTAARKRVQRWLLLACRALLIALLVWALAQPAKMLASGWAGAGKSIVASIVVDTSYSMQLQDAQRQQQTALSLADQAVQDLLRGPLSRARVAVLRSAAAPADRPEQLKSASDILSQWTPLAPEAARKPLADRIAAAANLVQRQHGDEKWLVVVSDLQAREFPQTLPEFDGRTVLIDLHPSEARSAGITRVALEPRQPIPGLPREAVVDVVGRSGDSRAVTVSLVAPDGRTLEQRPAQVAQFDASGRSRLRFPIRLPAERWTLMRGSLQSDDALPWDDARDELVEIPPRKNVAVIDAPAALPAAGRIVRLALDPSAGQLSSWPLKVSRDGAIAADTSAVVLISAQWPDAPTTARLRDFVSAGGTLIWFLRPGLEEAWKTLPDASKSPLLELLPAAPSADATVPPSSTVAVAAPQEPALEGLTDRRFELSRIVVRRFVPLLPPADDVVTVLTAAPANPGSGSRPRGLLYRRPVGRGSVFTWATVPDKQYNNLATHPVFLPMLVGIALGQGAAAGDAQNVELGEPISLGRGAYASVQRLELVNPRGEVIAVDGVNDSGSRRFTFSATDAPGLYTWRKPGETTPVGIGNVQLPAEEAQLVYKSADAVAAPGPRVMVARSVAELENRFTALSEPEPKWSLPIAIVLLLLCVEALMASTSKLWKPPSLRAFVPKVGEST